MKKILFIVLISFLFFGCNSDNKSNSPSTVYVPPTVINDSVDDSKEVSGYTLNNISEDGYCYFFRENDRSIHKIKNLDHILNPWKPWDVSIVTYSVTVNYTDGSSDSITALPNEFKIESGYFYVSFEVESGSFIYFRHKDNVIENIDSTQFGTIANNNYIEYLSANYKVEKIAYNSGFASSFINFVDSSYAYTYGNINGLHEISYGMYFSVYQSGITATSDGVWFNPISETHAILQVVQGKGLLYSK